MLRWTSRYLCASAAAAAGPEVHRDVEEFAVVIVGGGPSGLSAAIRLKQLAGDQRDSFRVGLVEKGSEIGAHTLSGACVEPHGLDELLPGWREQEGSVLSSMTPVTSDAFHVLIGPSRSVKVPWLPSTLHNRGNYITSLGGICKWLGEQAEALGVEIYPGFAAADVVVDEATGAVTGVQLNDRGVDKSGRRTAQYEPGMIFRAKQTIFAEGCRGSCTKQLEKRFGLRTADNPQTFGLGIKEVWEVPKERHHPGTVMHTVGWPTTDKGHDNTYGGAFLYHYGDGLISCGYVVGLDYSNPYCRPYMEMQKWKTHDLIRGQLEGGRPILYGARTLVEGGFSALPKLHFPGGVLAGDCAGFLNLPKIKGTHTAMKSGMLAAEAVYEDAFKGGKEEAASGVECKSYDDCFRSSWLYKELYTVRNVRQSFYKSFKWGMLYTGITSLLLHGREPWTLKHTTPDNLSLKPAKECVEIKYPKPDGTLTFDLLTNHSRSGTAHNADQPCHLRLKDSKVAEEVNLKAYAGPEARFCPAGVYEFVNDKLVINAQNCLHCKACDIKDPTQNINWTVPEGGGGPNYQGQM
ncbi:putative electron transfer flavoprotein-ubiquinone oxidoreductase [Leishmania major strain Friedlin]|uniref:Electron transfer flavoprotein-ubiquinone oxidoreductase n=1 Tax=Leishmania major TaxID=5664 RepID=Q4QIN2_LEIMA|nr:putative electron transfer flavoprotein-ubiquinone oxidoreductase [Leishmania major strain Friedlin]CAG9568997.1 electron_transfer_flavoprotein-ubiquinone_oxidoreductase_-_putative [Leishmania major strain Friedlin]CAJ07021.1 putative electron transfer flavoprotein-ubiquinone oxidoreductase [Leishmania major strain Friedlin]|eukprot:XP_001680966.1 putative electron transfer flavoprotein-ubiquinone oxidoreductase [Leishmania major strain Friedlin]